VDELLHLLRPAISAVFTRYSPKTELKNSIARQRIEMSMDEWLALLDDLGLLSDDFPQRSATLCFLWGKMMVADEIKRRADLTTASLYDFMNALALVAEMINLPSSAELCDYAARGHTHGGNSGSVSVSVVAFFKSLNRGDSLDKEAKGAHGAQSAIIPPPPVGAPPETKRPLHERLRYLLTLTLDRLQDLSLCAGGRIAKVDKSASSGRKYERVTNNGRRLLAVLAMAST